MDLLIIIGFMLGSGLVYALTADWLEEKAYKKEQQRNRSAR